MRSRVRRTLIGSAVLALLLNAIGAPAVPSPQSPAVPECSTGQLSDVMAVYLSVPAPKTTPMPIPPGVSSYLSKELQGRLAACQRGLDASEGRVCQPSGSESYDPRQLWAHLRFCELLKPPPPTAAPSVIPWELPGPGPSSFQPVIFVLGIGSDAATVSKLVSTLTVYLNDGKETAGYHFVHDAIMIPEPSWTTDYFASQCENSPHVEGAIVVNVTAAGSGASDEFVSRQNWTAIEATAAYAQCSHPPAASRGVPSYVWASNIAQAESHHSTFTPLLPLSVLLTLGAMYEEFAPQRATQMTTKRLFPAPKTVPKSGYESEVDTANTTTLNAAQVGSVAGGFLTSSIAYTNSAAPLTQTPAVDQQTWNTLQSIAIKLIGDMNCWQSAPEPIGSRSASDIIGAARSLPGYSPPAGLGAYTAGRPSATFCTESGEPESIRIVLPATASPSPAST